MFGHRTLGGQESGSFTLILIEMIKPNLIFLNPSTWFKLEVACGCLEPHLITYSAPKVVLHSHSHAQVSSSQY
jgi:hypothetical protein